MRSARSEWDAGGNIVGECWYEVMKDGGYWRRDCRR